MIFEAIFDVLAGLLSWVLGLFPTMTEPAWVGDLADQLADWCADASALAYWMPLDAVRNAAILLLSTFTLVSAIRVIRVVASFLTGGGGSAA